MKLLTETQKIQTSQNLLLRDGNRCIFVNHELDPRDSEIEHLDNNPNNNKFSNLALSCHLHNCEKRNSADFQIIAREKTKQNESLTLINKTEDKTPVEASTEIQININSRNIAKQFLTERIITDKSIEYLEALNCITFKCNEITGHGSQQSTRNYLDTLTCALSSFMIIKNEKGKRLIVERKEN